MPQWRLAALSIALLGTAVTVAVAAAADSGLTTTPPLTPASAPPAAATTPREVAMRHTQVSATAYTTDNLLATVRETLASPRDPLAPLAAESPGIGPMGTQYGQDDCVSGALPQLTSVELVDLALYDGQPAAVVVGTVASERVVAVVRRYCLGTNADVLHPATPLPQS